MACSSVHALDHRSSFVTDAGFCSGRSNRMADLVHLEELMQGMQIRQAAPLSFGGAERRQLKRGHDLRRCLSAVTANQMQQQDFSELFPGSGVCGSESSDERRFQEDHASLEDFRLYLSADSSRPMDSGGSSLWFLAA
jgi:hypothetical protein